MEMVLNADPKAIIIDTKKTGRPDMPAIIYGVYEVGVVFPDIVLHEANGEYLAIQSRIGRVREQ